MGNHAPVADAKTFIKMSKCGHPHQRNDQQDEQSAAELLSPYVEDGILDIAAWTHDALILSLPTQILCRPDCAGLCPYCGESMNGAEPGQHDHGQDIDPRWSKLKEIS